MDSVTKLSHQVSHLKRIELSQPKKAEKLYLVRVARLELTAS